MKRFKKYFALIFPIIFLYSCGFEPLYESKSYDFYFAEIKTKNDNTYFNIFKKFISKHQVNIDQRNEYYLDVNIEKNKKVLSRDSSGNPIVYMIIINSDISVSDKENIILSNNYEKKFKYSHDSSIFDLKLYEKEIEEKLIKQIIDELIISIISLEKKTSSISNTNKIKVGVNTKMEAGYAKGS